MIKHLQLLSCLGILILEKIIHAMVAPLLTQWDWVTTDGQQCNLPCVVSNSTKIVPELSPDGYLPDSSDIIGTHEPFSICQECQQDTNHEPLKLTGLVAVFLLIQPITNTMCSPLSGLLGDKKGYDFALLLGLFTSVIAALLFAFFVTFPALFSANLLVGIAGALNSPNTFAKLNKLYAPDSDMGKTVLGLAMTTNVFSFIAPVLVGILYEHLGQLMCFLILFLPLQLTLIASTCWSFCTIDQDQDQDTKEDEDEDILDYGATKSSLFENDDQQNRDHREGTFFKIALDHPKILLLTGAILVGWTPRKCIEASLAVWMSNEFNSGPSYIGLVLGSGVISVLAANSFAAWFSIRFPQHLWKWVSLTLAMCGVSIIALLWTSNYIALVSFYIGMYVFFACSARYATMGLLSMLAETITDAPRSKVMSIANIGMTLPSFIGPVISIPLYNHFGFHVINLVVGIPCVIYGIILFFVGLYDNKDMRGISDASSARYVQLPLIQIVTTKDVKVQQPVPVRESIEDDSILLS